MGNRPFEPSIAFRAMGTNAVPFLVSLITRDPAPSRFDEWRMKLPGWFRPFPKSLQPQIAAGLLRVEVKPPDDMLMPLLTPAILGTNLQQRNAALMALPDSTSFLEWRRRQFRLNSRARPPEAEPTLTTRAGTPD